MKSPNSCRSIARLVQAAVAAALALVLPNPAQAQAPTLLVRFPFTDTNAGPNAPTTCASDTSTGGANAALQMVASNGLPANFHGVPGDGVSGLGVALNFSSPSDFLDGANQGSAAGLGPLASTTNTALNFGAVHAFTATIWFNANAQLPNGTTTGPRIFTLGANGTADKASANSVGLYWQQWNEVAATINTTEINAPTYATFVPTNQWLFWAITYDGTTATIYSGTDGSAATAVASAALAGQTITLNNAGGSVLEVGNRANLARSFDGWLNDFRFYTNSASANFVEDIRWSAVVPTNVAGSLVNGQSVITWSPLAGAATYNVSSSTTSGGPYTLLASGVTATNYTDPTVLSPDTSYYYVVSAVNANGDQTTTSNSAQASVPPAPVAVIGTLEDGGIGLYWNDSDVTSYTILRSTSPNGPFVAIATDITGTNYLDTNTISSVQFYYYEVEGVNANGQTVPSYPVAVSDGQGNLLANPGFELTPLKTDWTANGNTPVIVTPGPTYYNAGTCPADNPAEQVVTHTGVNVGNIYGNFNAQVNQSSWSQQFSTVATSTYTAGAWTYASHEDLMGGANNFHYEVDFLNASGTVLAAYQSFVITNLTCGGPNTFPLDTWVFLPVTNQMQVTAGANTGTVIGSTGPTGVITAPAGSATVKWQAVFNNIGYAGGSIYLDDAELDLISAPVAPILTAITPNGITLCTNTDLNFTASSTAANIASVQLALTTSTLGINGTTNYVTNLTSAQVTGLGTRTVTINYPLTTNTFYNVTANVTDVNNITVGESATFDTVVPSLVIEASDFNFNGGQFTDTPANGGVWLYFPDVGEQGVDEQKLAAVNQPRIYRESDALVMQAANPAKVEQKFFTAAQNGDTTNVEIELGYNAAGDWADYSRSFGPSSTNSAPAGKYNIYLYMVMYLVYGDVGAQATLSQVTSDPTQPSQTTTVLGNFGNSSFSENDGTWTQYEYVPLVDNFGNLVSVDLSNGVQTLRSTVIANPNMGFYLLVPAAPALAPTFSGVYPDGVHPFEYASNFTFTIGAPPNTTIAKSGIDVVFNGVDITSNPKFSLTASGTNWIGVYPISPNAVYSSGAVVTVTNTAGLVSTFTVNAFDTFNINNYQWEAVDYDFSTNNNTSDPPPQGGELGGGWISGLYIDNPVPTGDTTSTGAGNGFPGVMETNSYYHYPTGFSSAVDPFGAGAIAQQGVDVNFLPTPSGVQEYYRADTVGTQPSTDYLRPKFLAAQSQLGDANIGPFNVGYYNTGFWLNYTRHYPTNNYYIWGRLAGGNGPFSGTTLSMVTSGVGTGLQTSNVLGTFSDPNAIGWQVYHWIPLLDTNGNMAQVSLGGLATLKVTSGNNLNMEFFMLAPAPLQFKVTPTIVGGQLNLAFPTELGLNYRVMYSSSLTSAWTPVGSVIAGTGAVVNVQEGLTGAAGYYTVTAQ